MASIARELAAASWRDQLRVVSWGGLHDRRHSTLQHELAAEGIHCQILDWHQRPPRIRRGDRLFLNSLALPEAVIQQALDWLQSKKISRVDWYCHEGNPSELLAERTWPTRIWKYLHEGSLNLKVPSLMTLKVYQSWLNFSGKTLGIQIPKLELETSLCRKKPNDFSELRLQLTGPVGCGKKGHLWLLTLLKEVLSQAPIDTPGLRPIRLHFIGVETGSYAALARDVCKKARQLLADRFSYSGQQSHELTLADMARSNIAISCSIAETFSLVTAEAMALGQPILRNQTGGWDEQLENFGNGFDLGSVCHKFKNEHLSLIQKLRSKSEISDQSLEKMGLLSEEIARKFTELSYLDWLS